jgi:hypothetical protein
MKRTSRKRLRRSIFVSSLLVGVLAAPLAHAGTTGSEGDKEFHRGHRRKHFPAQLELIVRAPGPRFGAIGTWEDRSGHRVRVEVKPGEGKDTKLLSEVARDEYRLVRCETT